jgi:beta-mannosidase
MASRVQSTFGCRRQPLTTGWELCSTEPDAYANPQELTRATLTWTSAHAPSTVAECLRDAKQWSLDDPPRRFDALDWWYRVRFTAPTQDPDTDVILGFDGLASVADVWLNGAPLLSGDNMFLIYQRLLAQPLPADNELVIRFRALDKLLAARRPRPKWRAPMVEHQQLRWFRTTLLGRTPGWSPPAAPVGPWRPVWIETREPAHFTNSTLRSGVTGRSGWLELTADIVATGLIEATLVVTRENERYSVPLQHTGGNAYRGRLEIPAVRLWWPHTHGEPVLYDVTVSIARHEIDLGHVGFRTIGLDTREGDFALSVNAVEVFCRGACWTPDPVTLRQTEESLRETLEQVRAAGMNMLRVGGTMAYESDSFLNLCDEYGILLWQDFMFANMNYPDEDPEFMASVSLEARQQLSRLAVHPCLAVLCGNSEGEQQAAMWGAPRESWETTLFTQLLPALARETCPAVPYWPSSAHGGTFPHQANVGTTSYYGVGAYLRGLEDARLAEVRFATESLAFANIPEPATLLQIPGGHSLRCHHPIWKTRAPRDLGAGWDFDDIRDHYLQRLFGIDPLQLRYSDHDRYLALSRVVSGEVMARVFTEWRRKRSPCRGGLVWFWRDLWPGAGWGVVDSLGTAKAPYHYLRRVLQPVLVAMTDEGINGLFVHIANERPQPLQAALELTFYRAGEAIAGSASRPVTLAAHDAVEWPATELFPGFLDLSYAYRFGPPAHDLAVATLRDEHGVVLGQAFHLLAGPGIARELDVGLRASATSRGGAEFELKIATRRFAQAVWIEADGFTSDDAYFHLAPGGETTVTVRCSDPSRALRGRVHALNAITAARIEVSA